MALFRRPKAESESAPAMDSSLTFMTVTEAERVRALVRAAFAEIGLEVTVFLDHVRDAQGRQFGLWNVAASCHHDERDDAAWPTVISEHVRRIVASMDNPGGPFADLSAADIAARTYARLYERAGVPGNLEDYPHLDFAPGLIQLLALDLPDTVSVFKREHVDQYGGWPVLHRYGMTNLGRETVEQFERVRAGEGSFNVLLGDSVYTASRALLMPQLATDVAGETPTDAGWLLSVPNRHQLCWHLIHDLTVIPALNGMAHFTHLGYSDAAGPLSPHVYWWSGSDYRQLTHIDEAGDISIHVGPDFHAILERLAATS
jgi:hypothetical protein